MASKHWKPKPPKHVRQATYNGADPRATTVVAFLILGGILLLAVTGAFEVLAVLLLVFFVIRGLTSKE